MPLSATNLIEMNKQERRTIETRNDEAMKNTDNTIYESPAFRIISFEFKGTLCLKTSPYTGDPGVDELGNEDGGEMEI